MEDFLDDGFEDLDANVLQELENNALQATQAQSLVEPNPFASRAADAAHPSARDFGLEFEDDDLDDAVVIDELGQAPAVPAGGREKSLPAAQPSRPIPTLPAPRRWNQVRVPSVNPARDPTPLRTQPYPLRPGSSASRPLAAGGPAPSQSQYIQPPPVPVTQRYVARTSEPPREPGAGPQSDIIKTLQSRLHALESELTSAKGEIAIVRSKFDKAQSDHNAELARLRKQNTEQVAKQERLVEAAVAAERTAATELQFTRQDLKEELGRAKLRRKDRDAPLTPRKNKSFSRGLGDGFDDIELIVSPSKGKQDRGKSAGPIAFPLNERTPTKGKRKRSTVDSPVNALETHAGDDAVFDGPRVKAEEPKETLLPPPVSSLSFDVGFLISLPSG
jgi:hypothetical protein